MTNDQLQEREVMLKQIDELENAETAEMSNADLENRFIMLKQLRRTKPTRLWR